ncbi:MAG: hypothetical protein A2826_02820 [Candidatus Doudnabacteria bacterium RIFCSPHIGHO2_01_FULL_43_23]|uniref:Glycosyltransferase subfamily 4-like N-terminal domain-containing protein n=1 Tax=Candidatus Doudnabacteria bacterium RIFCSPHIGHO2_01_FULL_43_23 TaxID=1817822 RepID=A0A1F5NS28_9BACT|nr:MAG: hypothetical protein A2826_02820 [Candidatus Doudnabacteria bacterium RIFCSPHIGHO2_01_FULL_43_23]
MKHIGQTKKILFIVTQGNWGGAQKYVFDLSTNLGSTYNTVVASGVQNQDLKQKLEEKSVKFIPLHHLVRKIHPVKDFRAFFEIYRLIKSEKPDIVHLNSSKAGVLGSLAARLAGTQKIIFTMHGLVLNEPLGIRAWLLRYLGEKISSYFKDVIIAVSDHDKKSALKYGLKSANSIKVIPVGIDLASNQFFEREEAREQLNKYNSIIPESFLIGTIADFYETKGLKYLVQAASRLIKDHSNLEFVLIGRSGPQEKIITDLINKHGLEDKILLVKNLDSASKYLKAFDIFLLPSVKEGLPYTILEAMAAEVPIIATAVGGIPDALVHEQSALLVSPADPMAIGRAVQRLLAEPRFAQKLTHVAHKKVQDFSLEKMIKETEKCYS